MIQHPRLRCVEFVEQVTDWFEGELSEHDCVLVEEHMVICPHCSEYAQQIRTAVKALRQMGQSTPIKAPIAVRTALLEAFRLERNNR